MKITVKELKNRLDQYSEDAVVSEVIDEETLADIFECPVIIVPDTEDDLK